MNTPTPLIQSQKPYLSMVTPTRNDNYAGGMLDRLQFTFNILFEQIERHQIESELILVEYNPPPDSKRLGEALVFPENSNFLSVRIIEVPPVIHARYPLKDFSPINGAVADNVGLSRARGVFSLLRVSDIIWSEEILKLLAGKDLDTNTKYRCTRCDISPEILKHPDWTVEQKMEFCRAHIITKMVNMKYYVKGLPDLLLNSGGDFQLMSTENFKRLRGYRESQQMNSPYCDGLLDFCAYAAGINDQLYEDLFIYKISHHQSYKNRILPSLIPFYDKIGTYIPSQLFGPLFIKYARMTGLTKIFLDNRTTTLRGQPQPTRNEYYSLCRKIVNSEISYVLNNENWGLTDEQLKEYMPLKAAWEYQPV